MKKSLNKADYIFEVSWEICNMVGGIHTVISTKALNIVNEYGDNYFLIGPDVWKETRQNPEFLEDPSLLSFWKEKALEDGLRIRAGRWNVAGNPLVILVDFTPLFSKKNEIFTELWEEYKLDSISGGWDYIEPALFGYAAAQVIESYVNFHFSTHDKIVAQFHEWMTGIGVLYLKEKLPQVACAFTTHATVLGRSIAGNNLPLYKKLDSYHPLLFARQFGVLSKYSLESNAAKHADVFTTVSEITARECKSLIGQEVDIVTPNGFDDSFVPGKDEFDDKRLTARKKLLEVARATLDQDVPDDSILIVNSGRYEFKNKGIDLFIDALDQLNKNFESKKKIIAFICVPAGNIGPRNEVLERLSKTNFDNKSKANYLTHALHDTINDPVLNRIRENKLENNFDDKVKIIFVPAYINKSDGIFKMSYFDLLIGFDISVFPSYYEPWGYTPLESVAFHIPTITTSLAGFGLWVRSKHKTSAAGVKIIDRKDDNDDHVVSEIVKHIQNFANKNEHEIEQARKEAYDISRIALWDKLLVQYYRAYDIALSEVNERSHLFEKMPYKLKSDVSFQHKEESAAWKKIYIKPAIPKGLSDLSRIASNLWWSWNYVASELFEMIDGELWERLNHNPMALLESISYQQIQNLEGSEEFLNKLAQVSEMFNSYMDAKQHDNKNRIAYFSMEYGLHNSLKIYSGGLGILAGDYLKEASDSNVNLIGIGLLYKYGYFKQEISLNGDQLSVYEAPNQTHLPLKSVEDEDGEPVKVNIAFPGRNLTARVWKVDVGRIPLYLLDADIDDNTPEDRFVTYQLYGGDIENRFKQELLLGVGGIRLLDALGIDPEVYHTNEGHAAFNGLERLRKLVNDSKLPYEHALELVRSSTLFTTHTPVPAGHDMFDENILRTYIPHYAERLSISWEKFMGLGRFNENDKGEKFSMSILAARLSQEINGVSKIHGRVSRAMFNPLYKGFFRDELHISHVTNGVHYKTWAAKSWQKLHKNEFGKKFLDDQSNQKYWRQIHNVSNESIWKVRRELKKDLIEYIKSKLSQDMTRRQEKASLVFRTLEALNDNTLTIGFARRFATYKRAHLLFTNLERLSGILNNEDKPVQLIFSGKAHPNDKAGQDLIKKIIEISRDPEFIGKIIFIENYDMSIAKKLVQGVDLWLNTPVRPLEASGTSGEKAAMNGVINFSVLDGWWAEGYKDGAGWAIDEKRTYSNQQIQDDLDAEKIYNILEDEIVPLYYKTNSKSIPDGWVSYIKNTISDIAPNFTMKRMLDDYFSGFYSKLFERTTMLKENNFDSLNKVISWKNKVKENWDRIDVFSVKVPDMTKSKLSMGENFIAEIVVDIKALDENDIAVQVLFGQKDNGTVNEILHKENMKIKSSDGSVITYRCDIPVTQAGLFDYIFRIIPVNHLLQYPEDSGLYMWL